MRRVPIGSIAAALALAVGLMRPIAAAAFTFSDGVEAACTAADGIVRERDHGADDPTAPSGFIGYTHFDPGAGWTIEWNLLMLSSLPGEVHDFVFFHECAHARARTFDEVEANCLGLIAMRAAGRAGRDVEAKLAAYHRKMAWMGHEYGWGSDFWARTLACANDAGRAKIDPLEKP